MVRAKRTSLELGLRGVVRVVQPGGAGIGSTPGGGGTATPRGLGMLGGGERYHGSAKLPGRLAQLLLAHQDPRGLHRRTGGDTPALV